MSSPGHLSINITKGRNSTERWRKRQKIFCFERNVERKSLSLYFFPFSKCLLGWIFEKLPKKNLLCCARIHIGSYRLMLSKIHVSRTQIQRTFWSEHSKKYLILDFCCGKKHWALVNKFLRKFFFQKMLMVLIKRMCIWSWWKVENMFAMDFDLKRSSKINIMKLRVIW